MKRTHTAILVLFPLLAILLFVVSLLPFPAHAASGSFTLDSPNPVTYSQGGQIRRAYTATFVASSSDNSVPPLTIPAGGNYPIGGMYLLSVETLAGTTAPSAAWTLTVKDEMKVDLLTSNGTSLSTSATTGVAVMPSKWVTVMSNLTAAIAGNTTASATGKVRFIFTSN